jgi:uncharacterized protein
MVKTFNFKGDKFMIRQNLFSQLTALSLALGTANLIWVAPALAEQQQQDRILTVTGQGTVPVPTTLTQVSLGVETQGKNADEVQEELAERSSAVVAFLRSRNVKKLTTTGISLQPVYSQEDERKIIGYVGRNTVNFRINTKESGKLIDEAVKAGATRINGIIFIATEEAIDTAEQEAIRIATLNAEKKAQAALGALNFVRRNIIKINIAEASWQQLQNLAYGGITNNVSNNVATPIVGGEQEVRASVTLQITY